MEGINSSLQVHEGTQSFAGRVNSWSISSEDSTRQQGLKCRRQDLGKMLGRSSLPWGGVQRKDPQDLECVEGIIIIIFLESVQIAE